VLRDWNGRTTSTYDAAGRLSTVTNPAGMRLTYAYDPVGRRATMAEPEGAKFTYLYNVADRLTRLANPQGQLTSYAYDAAGRLTSTLLANGTRASYTYDAADRVTRLANLGPGGVTLSSFGYAYDGVGNRQRVIEATGNRVTWSYDNLYRLTRELRSGSNSYAITYTYDAAGNRLTERNGGVPTTYTYGAANQLRRSQVPGGTTTYTYDGDGNLLTAQPQATARTTYSWDTENRLTRVVFPTGTADAFTYNGDGQRVQKVDSTGTTNFLWDGQNVLLEANAGNVIQAVYTLAPALYGDLLSQRRGGAASTYHFDGLGSTVQLSGATGSITDSYLYDSWGNFLTSTGSTVNWLRFVGRSGYYYDTDLAAYYLRARFYDPVLGRFVSRDPLGVDASTNLFIYVENSPLGLFDPSGMVCDPDPCAKSYWNEKSCTNNPPCPCNSTLTAKEVVDVEKAARDYLRSHGRNLACQLHIKRADCGVGKGMSWTCSTGNVQYRHQIYICISQDLNACQIDASLVHELNHALNFCNQKGAAGFVSIEDCRRKEKIAYTASCQRRTELECVPLSDRQKFIASCVNDGIEASCQASRENPCPTLIQTVFRGANTP